MFRCTAGHRRRRTRSRRLSQLLESLEARCLLAGVGPPVGPAADNVAPQLDALILGASAISEDFSVSASGTFRDTDLTDVLSLVIDWGGGLTAEQPAEGTTTITTSGPNLPGVLLEPLAPGVWRYSASHRYRDDNPAGTSADRYSVTAVVMDNFGGESSSATMSPGGDVFLTGHRVLSSSPPALDIVMLDFLRDAGGANEVPREEYDIGYLRQTSPRPPGGGLFGNLLSRNPQEFLGNTTGFAAFLAEIDVLYIPSFIDVGTIGSITLNTLAGEILSFFNRGGDIVVESSDGNGSFYDFLPARITAATDALSAAEPTTPTPEGLLLGIPDTASGLPALNGFENFSDAYSVFETAGTTAVSIGLKSGTVRVKNEAPEIVSFTVDADTISEGQQVLVRGSFTDLGRQDTHTVLIDWGDSQSTPTTLSTAELSLQGGIWRFEAFHRYLDDNPSGTRRDTYTISAVVTDDDTGSAQAARSLTVENVAPSVGGPLGLEATTSIGGSRVRVVGGFLDPGVADTHSVEIDWGGGGLLPDEGTTTIVAGTHADGSSLIRLADGTWRFTAFHDYGRDPFVYTVTATVNDDDLGVGSHSTRVMIENGAPTLEPLLLSHDVLSEGETITVTGAFSDPDAGDTHEVVIDWGGAETILATGGPFPDGASLSLDDGSWVFRATHQYLDDDPSGTPADAVVITAIVTDNRGGESERRGAAQGGNAFLTGHSVLSNDHQFGFDAVILDYLRGAGTAQAIPRAEYEIGYLRDSDHRTPGSGAFGSVTEARPADFLTGEQFAAYLETIDVLYIPWLQHVGEAGSAKINSFAAEFAAFFEAGGDVVVESSGGLSTYYDFLPFEISTLGVDAVGATGFTVTAEGAAIGISSAMIEGHGYHNQFADLDPALTVFEVRGEEKISLGVRNDGAAGRPLRLLNAAPQFVSFASSHELLPEDRRLSVSGEFFDPGLLDAHTVVIDWGAPSVGTTTITIDETNPAGGGLEPLGGGLWRFAAELTYPHDDQIAGGLVITATVSDDDTGSAVASVEVMVEDVPPHLDLLSLSTESLFEGGTLVVSGEFTDFGSDDHTIEIDWGMGSGNTVITTTGPNTGSLTDLGNGRWSFRATAVYEDDNPTATATDEYLISATIADHRGLSVSGSATLTVHNDAPRPDPLALPAAITEGETLLLVGSFIDMGLADEHTVLIRWGDGAQTVIVRDGPNPVGTSLAALGGGLWEYSAQHVYGDDNPTASPEDQVSLTVTISDDDLGEQTVSGSVIVQNAAPEFESFTLSPQDAAEGGEWMVSGTFIDRGSGDSHEVVIRWADGSEPTRLLSGFVDLGDGRWQFAAAHRYGNDRSGGYEIEATVTDDDLGAATASATAIVRNARPTLEPLVLNVAEIYEDGSVTVTGVFSDPGRLDTHSVVIDWGGGNLPGQPHEGTTTFTTAGALAANNSGSEGTSVRPRKRFRRLTNLGEGRWSFTATHQYLDDNPTASGMDNYTIAATVTDDAGAVEASTIDVRVLNRAPRIEALDLSAAATAGGQRLSVAGRFLDARLADTHTIEIDWGLGAEPTTLTTAGTNPPGSSLVDLGAGNWSFSAGSNVVTVAGGEIEVLVSVTDDDGGRGERTAVLEFQNAPPQIELLAVSDDVIAENESIVLTGEFFDPGLSDLHTVVIDWATGQTTALNSVGPHPVGTTFLDLGGGRWRFTAQHQYLDDNPTATPLDVYSIAVSVTDNVGAQSESSVELIVENLSPTAGPLTLSIPTAAEGEAVTATGTFADSGLLDTHQVLIDWGDGSLPTSEGVTTMDLGGGSWSFSATHVMLDDLPTGTGADVVLVTVHVVDDDGGEATRSAPLSVNNVGPVLGPLALDADEIDESDTVRLTGSFTDPGLYDTHTVVIDWNAGGNGRPRVPSFFDGTTTITTQGPNPAGTSLAHLGGGLWLFEATHQYRDDNPTSSPADGYLILVDVIDDDTVENSTGIVLTVRNTAPVIDPDSIVVDVPLADEARVGEMITISLDFTDRGLFDWHDVVIVWDDGDSSDTRSSLSTTDFLEFDLAGGGAGSFTAQHVYQFAGEFRVQVTVLDDDGGSDQFFLDLLILPAEGAEASGISGELVDLLARDRR